jgi:hypothetical protein
MAGDAEAVVRAVIDVAKGGDMTAARLVLDRIAPPCRGRPVRLDLPPIVCAADPLLQAHRGGLGRYYFAQWRARVMGFRDPRMGGASRPHGQPRSDRGRGAIPRDYPVMSGRLSLRTR